MYTVVSVCVCVNLVENLKVSGIACLSASLKGAGLNR